MRLKLPNESLCEIQGVLPLGKSNTVANRFFPGGDTVENVKSLADASLAIIEEYMKPIDVMKIEVNDGETQSNICLLFYNLVTLYIYLSFCS